MVAIVNAGRATGRPTATFIDNDPNEVAKRVRLMLPKETREKLRAIEREETKRTGERTGIAQKRAELVKERRELDGIIAFSERDKASPGVGGWQPDHERNLRDLYAQRDELSAEIEELGTAETPKLKKLSREESARLSRLGKFAPSWRDFLLLQSKIRRFGHFVPELPKLGKTKITEALAEVRAQSDAVLDELVAIEGTRLDLESIIKRVHDDVDRLAQAPKLGDIVRYTTENIRGDRAQGHIAWPREQIFSNGPTNSVFIQRGSSLLAWLFGDELKAKIEAEIRAKIGDKGGLSIAARNERIDDLEAQLLPLHRMEEQLYLAAAQAGHDVGERRKIHPMAFLEIVEDEATEAKERARLEAISKERSGGYTQDRKNADGFIAGPPSMGKGIKLAR